MALSGVRTKIPSTLRISEVFTGQSNFYRCMQIRNMVHTAAYLRNIYLLAIMFLLAVVPAAAVGRNRRSSSKKNKV